MEKASNINTSNYVIGQINHFTIGTFGDFQKFLKDLEQNSGHGLALIDFLWGKN